MEIALGIFFGVLTFVCVATLAAAAWGLRSPRVGRWLDAKAYRAFPRLGHLFIQDSNREDLDAS